MHQKQKQEMKVEGLVVFLTTLASVVFFTFMPGMTLAQHTPEASPTAAAAPAPALVSVGHPLDWQTLFGQAGVVGVLVWYLYYTTSIAFPKVRQDFRDELAADRKHHEDLMVEQRTQVAKLCDALTRLGDELRSRPCIYKAYEKGVTP